MTGLTEDFGYFADICFKYFGDRVKYWISFNEPNTQVIYGYRTGIFPPSRCSAPFGNCSHGDSEKEPFLAAHNMILSHASAVDIYRTKYQKEQGGSIGMVLQFYWYKPVSSSIADKVAAERAQAFSTKWFLDPIVFGEYPTEMRKILGSTLPKFSRNEKEKLKNGLDFVGINYYTSFSTQDCISSVCEIGRGSSRTEGSCRQTHLGEPSELDWLYIYPEGLEKIIMYVKDRYNNIPIIITENGYGQVDNSVVPYDKLLEDVKRVDYMASHLDALLKSMREGANVRGYFVWSLLDNFEWKYGHTVRFGVHHVDYTTQKRTLKISATWFKEFIERYGKITKIEHMKK